MARGYEYPNSGGGYGSIHNTDFANWGYIILYLIVIVGSVFGNSLFLWMVKKNPSLHRTAHFLLCSLAFRDLVVTLLVIPFVIDSQVANLMVFNGGDILCKLYSFLDYGTRGAHAFNVIFLALFLYFWYRKNEAYATENGTTVVRKTKMHKWSIPLLWVIGLGIAIPAGALAYVMSEPTTQTRPCAIYHGMGTGGSGYYVLLAEVVVAFILPVVVLVFPFLALIMQLCGQREPRLDPPHNRTAWTAVAIVVVFVASRAPAEIYSMMELFHQSAAGLKVQPYWGTPYAFWTFETELILNCIIYVAPLIHPILYFALNPDYRHGVRLVWRSMDCNKNPQELEQERQQKQQDKSSKRAYNNRNRAPPIIRMNKRQQQQQQQHQAQQQPLLHTQQPVIMSGQQVQYYPYPQQQQFQMQGQQQPMQHHPQGQIQQPLQQPLLMPEHYLAGQPQFLDNSFERTQGSPLPAVFEYNGFKYIDTANVEPKIAYSPEKTPPKTPETPHFANRPFRDPTLENQWSPTNFINPNIEMVDMSSPPIATSEPKEEFQLENLDESPGSTLKKHRGGNVDVEPLNGSPGQRRHRVAKANQELYQQQHHQRSNGHHRPASPNMDRPPSRVEITITGRTQSRTDLCPDVPRSKFEHSV